MGALHEGHLALIRSARQAGADRVVVSLFVNPKQFNVAADLARYPRQEESDLVKLAAAGADLAYLPTIDVMYPDGFATTISIAGPIVQDLEAAFRPGHFDGVATVVCKLLLQAGPDLATFGEKDYQQLLLVRRLVQDLDIPVRIVSVPTVRDAHGLALSSRNALLSNGQLAVARRLNGILHVIAAGEVAVSDGPALLQESGFDAVDYLAIRNEQTLETVEYGSRNERSRLLAAVRLGGVRLLDNVPMA